MWREVLRRRRQPSFGGQSGAGGKSLGVKKEVFITDKYGDSFTIWSNGGVLSPGNRKGWSDEGILRFNEYRTLITYFRKTTYGENAMKEQKTNWTQSLLVANRKRRSDMMESESTEVPRRERIICSQEEWDKLLVTNTFNMNINMNSVIDYVRKEDLCRYNIRIDDVLVNMKIP